jgi:predicted extracellular nuclease
MPNHPRTSGLRWVVLAALVLVGLVPAAQAQPTELFFSEYVEGSSNSKALEIFNGTGSAINLAAGGYNVQMFFNGAVTPLRTISLTGTVASGDVYVFAPPGAAAAILAVADQLDTNNTWFNGDDAVVLRKGTTNIDVIGQIGFDPGSEWGSGLTSTADNTLRRKTTVTGGDTNGGDVFNPAVEWNGFAQNTFNGLGCHPGVDLRGSCTPPLEKEIFEIQGNGLASPFIGQDVLTEDNVVTGVAANGFFIQTPDSRADLDDETSNGIFVFTGSAPTVQVGDQVDVQGSVDEFFNQTEMTGPAVAIDATGSPLPAAAILDASHPSPNRPQPATEMERFEGMIVRVENALASGPTDQFGDTPIIVGHPRAFREPGILFPGLFGLPVWDGNPELFEVNADGAGLPDADLPAGASIAVAEGPLAFSFGDYQIWPTAFSFSGSPAAVPVRARAAGEFTVASQNLLRLMDAVNDFCADDVPTAAVYANRLGKASRLIRESLGAPDVLAVQEVEKLSVLQDLAARIHADDASLNYTAYLLEGNDIGCIDVGFLVRDTVQVDSVTQFGLTDTFTFNSVTALLNDRPPLVLAGSYVGNGAPFPITVIAVHQRSLGGIENPADGPRVREKRHQQALRLSQFIQGLQTGDPTLRLVVTGDFNAFEFTDGYVDVMGQVTGNPDPAGAQTPATDEVNPDLTNQLLSEPAAERYSFVFDGSSQALDHSLTSQALAPFFRGLDHLRGNADSPAALLNDFTTVLRTADHDGLALYLMSDSDADGVPEDADRCPGTVIPESVPTHGLNPNHWALVDGDLIFDTVGTPANPYTVQQTAGCSCEQIIVQLGLGNGQRKHGCSQGTMEDWIALVNP